MKLKSISTRLRAAALAALFVVGTSAAANAATLVTFSTSGAFTASGGGGVISSFGLGTNNQIAWTDADGTVATLTFGGAPSSNVGAPTNAQLGIMALTLLGGDGNWGGDISGTTFDLTISQTVPSVGSGAFSSILTGTIVAK